MALSLNAAKTLEQVKMGLLMLYGADYFTQDEFIKIDGLIHKGKYVFTSGPPNYMHGEELMSFEDFKDEINPANIESHSLQPLEQSKEDSIAVFEENIPSPSSSPPTGSDSHTEESPNATSRDESDQGMAPSSSDVAPMFDFSYPTQTDPAEPSSTKPQPPTVNGLPPGITQEQLDEARLMQASMTKAGQKTRPKYERIEEPTSEAGWTEDFPLEAANAGPTYLCPVPSEWDTRISEWASEVKPQQPASPQIAHPSPSKVPPETSVLVQKFIESHGRKPKSLNDFYQPNNPKHNSNRAGSVSSNVTAKTSHPHKSPEVKVKCGATYIAQSGQSKSSQVLLEVQAGDHIKVLKLVSGVQWLGKNLRTDLTAQFSENIFKTPTVKRPKSSKSSKSRKSASVAPSVTGSVIPNGLENVEGTNAAEWDEVPVSSRYKHTSLAPARPVPGGGLSSSRFSVLAPAQEGKSQIPSTQQKISPEMKKEFGKMVNDKVDEILKARGMAPTPAPAAKSTTLSRSRTMNEPLQPVPPKSNTCWFWKTKNSCRFTAAECRDLHGILPTEPTNFHLGKPTWGALADSEGFSNPQVASESPDPLGRVLSCWYWSHNGNCNYRADNCKYLHQHSSKGVAPRPTRNTPYWQMHTWKRAGDVETVNGEGTIDDCDGSESTEEGELVLNEVNAQDSMSVAGWGVIGDGGAGGWGRDTPCPESINGWGVPEEKYKPPHIQALEQKASAAAVGW